MKNRQEQCIQQWEPAFRVKSSFFKYRMERRKYQDILCIPVFIILAFALISFSAYLTYLGYELYKSTNFEINFLFNFTNLTSQAIPVWISIGILIVANSSIITITIILLGKHPEIVIKILVITTVITLSGLSIYFFITKQYAFGAILLLLFVIYILAMFCAFRDHYKTCLTVVKIVGYFLQKKPSAFLIGIAVSFSACVAAGILILSAAGLLQMIAFDTITNTFGQLYLLTQIIQYIFIIYFVYYLTTFLVGCAVSNWYSQNSSYTLFTGLGWAMFNHLGSITFASLIITPMKIISTITDSAQKNADNMCAQVSICCLKPCISLFEGLVKTLNRYSIITIAYTGQSFVAGAKSAAMIVFSNLKMINIIQGVQIFFFLSLCLLSVIWSIGLGFITASILNIGQGVIFTSGVLILINVLTSVISTSIFTQSIVATCFFFLLQQKVKTYSHRLFSIDKKIKDLYTQLFVDNEGGNIQDSDDQVVIPKSKSKQKKYSIRDQTIQIISQKISQNKISNK